MQLTEEQRKAIDFALDMLLCAMRAANWEGDAAYAAGEKARELLAAHNAGAQEPVAWMRTYRQFRDTQSEAPDPGYTVTSFHQNAEFAAKYPAENTPLYSHPQPITDAARDAKRYQAIRAKVLPFNAYASGNPNWTFPDYGPRGATFDEAIDAEIERLDRAKGE